jgi:hypothetical protein
MDPHTLLDSLCQRHGVQPDRGERLLPLLEWALRCPQRARDHFLDLAERGLADDARGLPIDDRSVDLVTERALLLAVAKVMHAWKPREDATDLGMNF